MNAHFPVLAIEPRGCGVMPQLTPPVAYYGSKVRVARRIIELLPEQRALKSVPDPMRGQVSSDIETWCETLLDG
jgi:hypothetical protein